MRSMVEGAGLLLAIERAAPSGSLSLATSPA